MNSRVLDMFKSIQRHAIYLWDIHVECIEKMDCQMKVDNHPVFHNTDFMAKGPLAGEKLSHYADIFRNATKFHFQPRVLVENMPQMQRFQYKNYEQFVHYILQSDVYVCTCV